MNKKVLIINISIIIISLFLLLRGLYLITNSGAFAVEMMYDETLKDLTNYFGETKSELDHYISVVKIKGVILSLLSLGGFVLSLKNINKEVSIKL